MQLFRLDFLFLLYQDKRKNSFLLALVGYELSGCNYSTRHLTLLAKAFGYKNISDMMKFPTPEYGKIKVTLKQTMNESGTKALSSEVVIGGQ